MRIDAYIVTSTRRPPNHDAGSWSSHPDLYDAAKTARRVSGTIWFCAPDGNKLIMREIKI